MTQFFLAICSSLCFFFITVTKKIISSITVLTAVLPGLPIFADTLSVFWCVFLQLPAPLIVGTLEGLVWTWPWRTCREAPADLSSSDGQAESERETFKWRRTLFALLPSFLPLDCHKRVQHSGIDADLWERKAQTVYAFASLLCRTRG